MLPHEKLMAGPLGRLVTVMTWWGCPEPVILFSGLCAGNQEWHTSSGNLSTHNAGHCGDSWLDK